MDGKIQYSGNEYRWWAGPADSDLNYEYCVHCCRGEFGVTRYLSAEPDETQAKQIAQTLAPMVDGLS